MARGYARGRQRDEAVRATLRPLARGERPRALVVAVAIAALLGVGNLAALAAGLEVSGEDPAPAGVAGLSALLLLMAWGMWTHRYWAVLGFEVLLGVSVTYAALSLLVASTVRGAVLSVAIILLGGWLFWKLVRAMARIQMPQRKTSA